LCVALQSEPRGSGGGAVVVIRSVKRPIRIRSVNRLFDACQSKRDNGEIQLAWGNVQADLSWAITPLILPLAQTCVLRS
jgi:hypothetical protein